MTTIISTLQSEVKGTSSTPTMSSTDYQGGLVKHIKEPWEYISIENFLSPDRWQTIRDLAENQLKLYYEWLAKDNKVYFNKENARRNKYNGYEDTDIIPETNELFYKYKLDHREYTGKLKKVIHWAIAEPGWVYPAHCDNRARISTTIMYVDPDRSDGTILHANPSKNDKGDHEAADKESSYTYEIPWKPNKVFFHNPIPNKTWHSIRNSHTTPRITLNTFLVQEDLVAKNRCYSGKEIEI
tara:strand:+ start:129 stop:851 length:723 start_codon:yes stop_codon:yes gene_type:complete